MGGAQPQRQASPASTHSPHGNLSVPCQNCHTFSGWKPIRSIPDFDHNKTRYPLRGMHKNVACVQCHSNPVFTNIGSKCADCHADIHRRQMGAQCERCHTVNGWMVSLKSVRDHSNRFPLIGAHAVTDCDSCHKGGATGQFQGLSTDCISCHMSSYLNTKTLSHTALGFPTQCQQCHSSDSWAGARFDHGALTGFPLTGAHASLDCTACHVGGKYQGTPTNCVSCHLKDFNGAKDPDHVKIGFPQTCAQCHATTTWLGATFDHASTGFALSGAHATLNCSSCHSGGTLTAANTSCVSCHLNDFNHTTNPNHVAGGFSQQCTICHNTTAWQPASFDHSKTVFPLTGAHTTVPCTSCHVGGQYSSAQTACSGCHMTDYQKTTNPSHLTVAFPTTCNQCHNTSSWAGATFDHSTTGWALTGAHASQPCSSCHAGAMLTAANTQCSNCHLTDYQKTTNPNHISVGFPTDCSVCHSTVNWTGATFDHTTTGWALTGAHTTLACSSCHKGVILSSANTACVSCHLNDFNGTTNPNHVAAQFPQQCEVCHSTSVWQPSTFNHNNTVFPLTGAHTTVPCASCHIAGRYAGTPTDCYSCHKTDYQGVTNPNHVAAGFPTTCLTCHTTTSWLGATFNHTWFSIPHHTARLCSDCHTNSSDYSVFVCTSCHAQATTTSQHQGIRGFVWNSTNCYSCHKN